MATKWLCVPFLQKKCSYKVGGGGVIYVHLQNKYRKEDFQNIIYFKLRKQTEQYYNKN